MQRTVSELGPFLFLAVVIMAASGLAAGARGSWMSMGAAVLVPLALVGVDGVRRRGGWPSAGVLVMAAALLAAFAIVASGSAKGVAEMIPILGSCAVVPLIVRRDGRGPAGQGA